MQDACGEGQGKNNETLGLQRSNGMLMVGLCYVLVVSLWAQVSGREEYTLRFQPTADIVGQF